MKRREFLKQGTLAAAYTLAAQRTHALTQGTLERKGLRRAGLAG